MELNVHDLVVIKNINAIIFDTPEPEWVKKAVACFPFAVIRRAAVHDFMAPIGIRGDNRNQRQAAEIGVDQLSRRMKPEDLSEQKIWHMRQHLQELGIADALEDISRIMPNYSLAWGPVGSVGFELASGAEVTNADSDLDIVIRLTGIFSKASAKRLVQELKRLPLKTDILLETSRGGVALTELISGNDPILFRTENGPKLVRKPSIEHFSWGEV